MITKARFMLLCHGRVGTASLLESLQEVDEVFVPSYWHTDGLLESGTLEGLLGNTTRLSEQCSIPTSLDDISIGLINHNFPTQLSHAERTCRNIGNVLSDDAPIFIWTRSPVENILSSYRTYLEVYYIFKICEGNENARGIYDAFNTPAPLGLSEFIDRHGYIVDYRKQEELYSRTGRRVHLRRYENLRTHLQGEIEAILEASGIRHRPIRIQQVEYSRADRWAIQVSFAFRNTRSIDGLPLAIGYFNPPRNFPNQGALTLELRDNLFVAPDQWFRIPRAYKKRILAMRDPWKVLASTLNDYTAFERKVEGAVKQKLAEEDWGNMEDTARHMLESAQIATDFD